MPFKKFLSLLLFLLSAVPLCGLYAESLDVSAKAAALMDAGTGELLYSKNADKKLPMASTTKIMTSLLAIEAGTPRRVVKITERMTAVEGTSMGLLPGDHATLIALVCGMLLSSGNDAANAVALALGKTPEGFAEMMNLRAREIGMNNTAFVTASGLDDGGHYSTARDMALLGREAILNPVFRSICEKESVTVEYGNPPYKRTLTNHNRLLKKYRYAIGIKTGFTKKSGRCLVSAAERDGITLVAVTLNAPDDWNDHINMLEYGFSVVKPIELDGSLDGLSLKVVGGERTSLPLKTDAVLTSSVNNSPVTREILLKKFEYAPIEAGTVVGKAIYIRDGKTVCEADIVTSLGTRRKKSAPDTDGENSKKRGISEIIIGFFRSMSKSKELSSDAGQ